MKFSVRRFDGADNPQNGYETVEADSAKAAAEQVCGESLIESGVNARLRAEVLKQPAVKNARKKAFFSMP